MNSRKRIFGIDETYGKTYGTYVDNACFDIHDYDDDTDHDTDDDSDDDTDDDTNDVTDDGGRGNLYSIKVPGCCSWVPGPWFLVLDPRSSVLGPWSSVLGPWSCVGWLKTSLCNV